jgi:prolyl oligopeptidase
MLRLERDPNGAFNTTEYGSVKDPEQFKALYAYSPYQHVRDKVAYPAVMFLTGDNDARVNPAHSRKMTAALQSATASALPVLLRTTSKAGHGFGTSLSEAVQQQADSLAFLYDQLGIKQVH